MPIYYKGNAAAIICHGQDLLWPGYTEKLGYELEIALVIAQEGRNIKAERADDYVFGFSCFNDFNARDNQMEETIHPTNIFGSSDVIEIEIGSVGVLQNRIVRR